MAAERGTHRPKTALKPQSIWPRNEAKEFDKNLFGTKNNLFGTKNNLFGTKNNLIGIKNKRAF